jgi:hypothetical protein
MNWGKRFLTMAALLGVFASGMVGCSNKGSDNNGTSGNVSMSGTSLSASDNVSGYPVSLQISTTYSGYGTSSQTVIINGQQVPLSPMQVANYMSYGPQYFTLGSYAMAGVALCTDTTCAKIATVLWAQPNMYGNGSLNSSMPMMQVGFLRYSDGSIHASMEKVGCAYNIQGTVCSSAPALSSAIDVMNWLLSNAK